MIRASLFVTLTGMLLGPAWLAVRAADFIGTVTDADTGRPIPARVYVEAPGSRWLFVTSADPAGTAVPYDEQWVAMPGSVDRHTTISAHPFRVALSPGSYRVTVERGKEYHPLTRTVVMTGQPRAEHFPLRRWVDMAARGWYSGETHVHRRIEELPNVVRAEDLNVAFPVTFWTTRSDQAPTTAPSPLRPTPSPAGARTDAGAAFLAVDATHVLVPRNTEYEIFSVGDRQHVLGAISLLNHQTVFTATMPPVAAIAARAHREGALIDLDKHNWPWSMMLVPVARVDLFELANNSVWRTAFGFRSSLVPPADFMTVETDAQGMTEKGWLDFGFQTYYTLLDCGFRLRPTAGTASGVHPVPLGFSRVYVHLGPTFDARRWIDGLNAGQSFVTTGPMLLATVDGEDPGHVFRIAEKGPRTFRVAGESLSARPIDRIELVVNGQVVDTIRPENRADEQSAYTSRFAIGVPLAESSWVAVRSCEVEPDGRTRFAHTAPFHVEMAGALVRPRRREVEYLVGLIRAELARNTGVLPPPALDEYRQALRIYQEIAGRARE